MDAIKPGKIQIGAVHFTDSATFWDQFIKNIYVMDLAIGYGNEAGDNAAQIQQGM